MAQFLIINNNQILQGVGLNCDRLVTINPTGTITIYDDAGVQLAVIQGSDPEISTTEG